MKAISSNLRAFLMDMLKAKINSNLAHKPKKGLPMDELQARQNEFLLQLQGIYALHCSFAIRFFYYFLFCSALLSLPFFFLLFCSSLPWLWLDRWISGDVTGSVDRWRQRGVLRLVAEPSVGLHLRLLAPKLQTHTHSHNGKLWHLEKREKRNISY